MSQPTGERVYIEHLPGTNFVLTIGEAPYGFDLALCVKKTVINRLKWWLFCRVFPLHIKRWDDYKGGNAT